MDEDWRNPSRRSEVCSCNIPSATSSITRAAKPARCTAQDDPRSQKLASHAKIAGKAPATETSSRLLPGWQLRAVILLNVENAHLERRGEIGGDWASRFAPQTPLDTRLRHKSRIKEVWESDVLMRSTCHN